MDRAESSADLRQLSPEAKKQALFERQKQLLDTFLANGAISRTQYNTSLEGLKSKMGIEAE